MLNIAGIKQWLSQVSNAEIRLGLAQARNMNLDFDDASIIELFGEGIFVEVVIRNVMEGDYLPGRLESDDKIEGPGFVKIKILDLKKDNKPLNILEIVNLLLDNLDNEFKVASPFNSFSDNLAKIRIISIKKDRFLNHKEISELLHRTIPSDNYEFYVEEI